MKVSLCGVVITLVASGCGGNEGPQDERFNLDRPAEAAHAENLRGLIAGLNDSYRSEGVPGLRSQVDTALENMEQFHGAQVGEQHRPTYEQVEQKLGELKTLVESTPDRATISEKLQEINDLVEKLPKAEAPPASRPAG